MTVTTTEIGRGAPVDAPSEHAREALSAVRVAGALLCTYRGNLVHEGVFEGVRTIFQARSGLPADWLDQVTPFEWVEFEHFRTLVVSFADVTGLAQLRAITRYYTADSEHGNLYAPILRSWMRSFGHSVEHTLRCVVPLWRRTYRYSPPPDVLLMEPGEVHVVIGGPVARAIYDSEALAISFENILLGILDVPRPRPLVDVEFSYTRDEMLSVVKFQPAEQG